MPSTHSKPSASKENIDPENVVYTGPAKQKYPSLMDLAAVGLDSCCPNLFNMESPTSHIIPSIFTFKNPELSDDLVNLQKNVGRNPIVAHRQCDDAEQKIHQILKKVIDDRLIDPFLAIHDLDLKLDVNVNDGTLKGRLVQCFRNFRWVDYQKKVRALACDHTRSGNCEFDYILIGPKIGIIVVEVKSSYCNSIDLFRKLYFQGVGQLLASDAFIDFLIEVTGILLPPDVPVRKVLFCPNLEREKYDYWKSKISVEEAGWIESIDHTIFKDDMANGIDQDGKPDFYRSFVDILQSRAPPAQNSVVWYIAYSRIMAGIASIVTFEKDRASVAAYFSESKSILNEDDRLSKQNPRYGSKKVAISEHSDLQKASVVGESSTQEAFKILEIMYLSLDQLNVMTGSNRQFIAGAAGTGKTILLQAKAIEAIRNGGLVLVLAHNCTHSRWRSILQKYDESSWSLCSIPDFIKASEGLSNDRLVAEMVRNAIMMDDYTSFNTRLCSSLFEGVKLRSTDQGTVNILIDDAFSDSGIGDTSVALLGLFLMTLFKQVRPSGVVWVAMDPNQVAINYNADLLPWGRYLQHGLVSKLFTQAFDKGIFSQNVLKRVLRCSSHVFNAAYLSENMKWPDPDLSPLFLTDYTPVLGHKIMGDYNLPFMEECVHEDRMNFACNKLAAIIKNLVVRGALTPHLCVILTGSGVAVSKENVYQIRNYMTMVLPDHTILGPYDDYRGEEKTLTVALISKIASAEWPLVIHVSFLGRSFSRINVFERYFARSRAMTSLIELQIRISDI